MISIPKMLSMYSFSGSCNSFFICNQFTMHLADNVIDLFIRFCKAVFLFLVVFTLHALKLGKFSLVLCTLLVHSWVLIENVSISMWCARSATIYMTCLNVLKYEDLSESQKIVLMSLLVLGNVGVILSC
jgi:hypothetical protein